VKAIQTGNFVIVTQQLNFYFLIMLSTQKLFPGKGVLIRGLYVSRAFLGPCLYIGPNFFCLGEVTKLPDCCVIS
jgi:hypothetical protein